MEKGTIDVLVIGTEPPCPRCDLLALLVEEILNETTVDVHVRHCAFDAPIAVALGRKLGRKIGTAKEVAETAGLQIDWEAVYGLIERKRDEAGPDCRMADVWTAELDEILKPCQVTADSVGYFMTPILVVNEVVKHHGSVPSPEQIRAWVLG